MSQKISGNLSGLTSSELRKLDRLFRRSFDRDELIGVEFAREILRLGHELSRRIGVLVSREGAIEEVFLGTKSILYLPDLGRYRLGPGRLRRLRLIYTDLSSSPESASIPTDIYTDLEKLRLDAVVGVKEHGKRVSVAYSHLAPASEDGKHRTHTETFNDIQKLDLDFYNFIAELEAELGREDTLKGTSEVGGVVLVGVYSKKDPDSESSMEELKELARTAGVKVKEVIVQKRDPDPRTLLGKGKLEEVVLTCLRLGAEMIIFDTELKPAQWRAITNSTDLKVIDRSMLILDIFAQRATSSDGRLQVELAQLKYSLPRLVEKDAGLSRLSGGIGGRGPGETKLEIGRRRIRDRISELEKRIDKLGDQRDLRRTRRVQQELPLVCIVGYTNVGKSTLFNFLTRSAVIAENKLFATLDPAQRRLDLLVGLEYRPLILSDTVGFIRKLPAELTTAFRATLEELTHADLLIHVLDVSDPRILDRKKSVEDILKSMEIADTDTIIVLNKCDKVTEQEALSLSRELNALCISASKGVGMEALKNEIVSRIFSEVKSIAVESPQI